MVLKIIDKNSNGNGDMFNLLDHYGLENDSVIVKMPTPYTNTIKTYGGDDSVVVVGTTTEIWVVNTFELGSGNDKLQAGNGAENYYDQSGNDVVAMGAGNDFVRAGLGNDKINGGSGIDLLSFSLLLDDFGNSSFVTQGVTFDLAVSGSQQLGVFGTDSFSNFENVDGTLGNDSLYGSSEANELRGSNGLDLLNGRAGNDTLHGGADSDVIVGGAGADQLWGGVDEYGDDAGDIFIYLKATESSLAQTDTIWDFETHASGGHDKIDLSAIDASSLLRGNNAFVFVGSSAFSSSQGEVSIYELSFDTIVSIDTDGDAAAEMMIILKGVTDLAADDFVL